MTTIDLLNEVLKDPMFRDKYNISDEDLVNVSFDTTSNHRIIEVVRVRITPMHRYISKSRLLTLA